MFKKILLPTDGSDHSFRAAQHAKNLAKASGGTVDLIYVIDEAASKVDILTNASDYEKRKKREEKIKKTTDLFEENGVLYTVHYKYGHPGPTIVQFANKNDYDCVVVGSRGLNQFQTMVLGSVSQRIVKRVKVPVLVVK